MASEVPRASEQVSETAADYLAALDNDWWALPILSFEDAIERADLALHSD